MVRPDMSLHAQLNTAVGDFHLTADITVAQGEIVAIVGPNGAGKSTLLRALAGLTPLTKGRIALNDCVLDDPTNGIFVPPEQRCIGTVFQDLLLLPHLSALDNVAFGLRCRGLSRNEARQRALPWLSMMRLDDKIHARPGELSGGQAQRVALARALAVTPDLLLLDEPLSALDVATRAEVHRDLQRVLASFPGVRLIVTHDPAEALTLADHLVILENGRIIQRGTPTDVTRHPRSSYVATFVGANLFRGVSTNGHITVDGGCVLHDPAAPDGDVFALVHPRAVSVHTEPPHGGSPRNIWHGNIDAVDITGAVARVAIASEPPIVAEITIAAMAELRLTPGTEVWATVKATEISSYAQ